MKYTLLAFCCFGLAGCEGDSKRLWAQHEIEDLVEDQVLVQKTTIDNNAEAGNRLVSRVDELELENAALKESLREQDDRLRRLEDAQSYR